MFKVYATKLDGARMTGVSRMAEEVSEKALCKKRRSQFNETDFFF